MRPPLRILLLLALFAACVPEPAVAPQPGPVGPALVIRGGVIHTMAEDRPQATVAVAVGGRWTCVGDAARCASRVPPDAEVLDLHGGSALPGLADAHGHVVGLGLALHSVDLRGARDERECIARIVERARTLPAGAWVWARGWDQTRWPSQRFPTSAELSRAVPDHPVFALRIDGHAAWVNAIALAGAHVTRDTPDPAGGRIVRGDDGAPTGILVDNAQDLVQASVPPLAADVLERAIVDALGQLVALGITSVHDAGVDEGTLAVYRRLAERGALPIHVYAMLDGQQPMAKVRAQMETWRKTPTVGRLTVRAVKMYADGALGSRGALLSEPYSDDPTSTGLAVTAAGELRERILEVTQAGYQPAVHAIGDRAVHEVLEDFLGVAPLARDLRPRVEHLQILGERDVLTLVASHAVASMQPTHATSDGPWAEERLGHGSPRQRGAYAWRTVLDAGAPLACGSDFPVEEPDPYAGIRSAVLRTWPGGPADGWMPEQRMTLDEAVHCFTTGAAFAEHAEGERGRIAEGALADAAALSVDPYVQGVAALDRGKLVATVVEGRVVWRK